MNSPANPDPPASAGLTDVALEAGVVRGRLNGLQRVFYGIPYAVAPTGAGRFALPAPHPGWNGVRDATRPGPTAPQPPRGMFGTLDLTDYFSPGWIRGDEYLSVTVYAPAEPLTPAVPVLVFLHGGGFVAGSGYVPLLDGRHFAERGVIVVTVNYRLGIPGFLDIAGAPRNRGLADVHAALGWVQANIAAFGGDPGRVTLGGQSAGAILTGAAIAANEPGLFARAIMQSGSGTAAMSTEHAKIVRVAAASILGIEPTLEQFARLDDDTLTATVVDLMGIDLSTDSARDPLQHITPFSVVLDEQPATTITQGRGAAVELLIGHNSEEGNLYLVPSGAYDATTEDDLAAAAIYASPDRHLLERYRSIHPDASPGQLRSMLLGDAAFGMGTRTFADAHADARHKTYVYDFAWRSSALSGRLGATHVVELPFAFNTLTPILQNDHKLLGAGDAPADLAPRMHQAWVDFVTTGDPGWHEYSSAERATMHIDAEWQLRYDPYRAQRQAWTDASELSALSRNDDSEPTASGHPALDDSSDAHTPLAAAQFSFVESVVVAASPAVVYDLISNVENISRWSPDASAVAYDPGDGPQAGDWFSGINSRNDRQWVTRSQIHTAIRPTVFAFHVNGLDDGIVRWQWSFAWTPDSLTAVSLTWSLLRLDPVLGQTREQLHELRDHMRGSVQQTLNALRTFLEFSTAPRT